MRLPPRLNEVALDGDPLSHDRWFSGLPARLAESLLAISIRRRFDPGQRVCLRGQDNTGIYGLVTGVIHVLNHAHGERDTFLNAFEAPMWFGELGLFDDGHFSHDAYAQTQCAVLFLPRERLHHLLAVEPTLWRHFGILQALKLRLAYFAIDELSGMPSNVRLARRLLAKGAGYGMRTGFSRTLAVRQEQLARGLGLARASITPILRSWRVSGVIELGYGTITLSDVEQLKTIAHYRDWPDFYKGLFDVPDGPHSDEPGVSLRLVTSEGAPD